MEQTVLTLLLWLISFVIMGIVYTWQKNWGCAGLIGKLVRIAFSVMCGLSFWVISTYILWLAGINLDIGTVKNGKMSENWFLPIVTPAWTLALYWVAKR